MYRCCSREDTVVINIYTVLPSDNYKGMTSVTREEEQCVNRSTSKGHLTLILGSPRSELPLFSLARLVSTHFHAHVLHTPDIRSGIILSPRLLRAYKYFLACLVSHIPPEEISSEDGIQVNTFRSTPCPWAPNTRQCR